ncbi:hypothetical protein GCM10023238_03060 [Streptomyces heliomycini]
MCCPAVSPVCWPAGAVVIGGGVSGWNAAQIAIGMGFHVTLLDKDINKLRRPTRSSARRSRPSSPTPSSWRRPVWRPTS